MALFALADLHLSFGVPDKAMDRFGGPWIDHARKVEEHWRALITPEDLVLIPGDISWAMRPEEAQPDLNWIGALPGTKLLLKGNHDFWWGSRAKVEKILPPSCHLLQNSAFEWQDLSIAGSRLWETDVFEFGKYVKRSASTPKEGGGESFSSEENAAIFARELGRLERSLQQLNPRARVKIAMTHYPPIGPDLAPSVVSEMFERYGVSIALFGHLHNLDPEVQPLFGTRNGVRYLLTACDYLNCIPLKVLP